MLGAMMARNTAALCGSGSGVTLFYTHGVCRSCEVPGVTLRTQVSVDLWGSPGAMAGASLVRAGAEVMTHMTWAPFPRPFPSHP